MDKLNSHQVSKDQLNEEEKEFAYFWENAYSPDMDTTGIKTKLEKKIRKEQKKEKILLTAQSLFDCSLFPDLICYRPLFLYHQKE